MSWEGDDHATKFFSNVAQNLTPLVGKVLVMRWVDSHCFFSDIVLRE